MEFEHLKKSAELGFSNYEKYRDSKPEASKKAKSSAHEALAGYHLANDNLAYIEELRLLLINECERYSEFQESVRSFPQFKFVILALAIGEIALATKIAAFKVNRQDWSAFESLAMFETCNILNISQNEVKPSGVVSKLEQVFITALLQLQLSKEFNETEFSSFWNTLKKKRYQQTIFEHKDLFILALRSLKNV